MAFLKGTIRRIDKMAYRNAVETILVRVGLLRCFTMAVIVVFLRRLNIHARRRVPVRCEQLEETKKMSSLTYGVMGLR